MDITVDINFNSDDVTSFQSRVTEPFYTRLKENIANRFVSQDVVSCFTFLIPRRLQILWKTVRMEKTNKDIADFLAWKESHESKCESNFLW